jgi:organic hydroperoxide reductase OsmC/OhrA
MRISARIENKGGEHHVTVSTSDRAQHLNIPPKANAPGSSVNGSELLFLALATCYCHDVYREAAKRGIQVDGHHARYARGHRTRSQSPTIRLCNS